MYPARIAGATTTRVAANRVEIREAATTVIRSIVEAGIFNPYAYSSVTKITSELRLELKLTKFSDSHLIIVEPIPVVISMEEGEYVASLRDIEVCMTGATCSDAFSSLRDFVERLYKKLNASAKLGPAMREAANYFDRKIRNVEQQNTAESCASNSCKA